MRQTTLPSGVDVPPDKLAFYRDVLQSLNSASLPFLVGGSYALSHYTQINRRTDDFDIFIDREDFARISDALSHAGYFVELTYPHWLGKVYCNGNVIDLVFSSGNGIAAVDQVWFDHAVTAQLFGIEVKICPAEETLWSKAFIMERERYDGADVIHLLLKWGERMDWQRLLDRFGSHWELLLSHLIMFGFIYPNQCDVIPLWVMNTLLARLQHQSRAPILLSDDANPLCNGTLLSREQYLVDVTQLGYEDARVVPLGNMTRQDTAKWTEAIKDKWG